MLMKNLFTLLFVFLAAVGVKAQVTNLSLANGWGTSITDVTLTGDVEFNYKHSYAVIYVDIEEIDLAEYPSFEIELSEDTPIGNLQLYVNTDAGKGWSGPLSSYTMNNSYDFLSGEGVPTKVTELGLMANNIENVGKVEIKSWNMIDKEGNKIPFNYKMPESWNSDVLTPITNASISFTNGQQWNSALITGAEGMETPVTITVNSDGFPANLQLKIITTENTEGYYRAIPEGATTFSTDILADGGTITEISLQLIADVSPFVVKNFSATIQPYVEPETKDLLPEMGTSGWNATWDASTKTITIDGNDAGEGGGKGWWYNPTADFSHFDNLVIEFDPATTFEGVVAINYSDENKDVSKSFFLGATCVIIHLDEEGKSSIKQIYISGDKGATFTLKAAYVATSEATTVTEDLGTTFTVAGAETLLGSSWDINDKSNTLTFDGTNYTLEKTEVTLEKGVTYEFKVVKNHSWSPINYGKDGESGENPANATITVDQTAVYTVTFTFSPDTPTLTATVEKTGDAEEQEHEWSVKGDFNGDTTWENEYEMTKGEDGKFTVSIPVTSDGDVEFKVRADRGWSISYPASNYKIEGVEAGTTVVITFDPETHVITVSVATGINALAIEDDQNAPIFNLAGQRVDKEYKGVVIQNGKKLLVK